MIILRYLKPLSPSSRIVLLFGRLKKCCSTSLPREFRILSGVFLLPSTWSLFRFTWLNFVLLFVFFRPCKEFSPSRLLLSHLGLLSIEGLMVKQYCYSVCAFLKGFCQTGIRGGICSYQCFQELYLETGHGKVHFSQHFCSRLTLCTVTLHSVQSFDKVSVKIVGTLNCLLTLPMLVCNIWWVNRDEQHWEDKETGQK